ncbi:hypothetical protein [Chitinophaga hostae]|uniref:hypothetical protein n=1 Tax=Chitinophaga hostae TaxID=2831022 RepID=UPI003F6A1958
MDNIKFPISAKPKDNSTINNPQENIFLTFFDLPGQVKLKWVSKGVSKKMLEELKIEYGLQYDELSSFLNVSDRTLHLKKGEEKYSNHVADKVFAIIDLYSFGISAFSAFEIFHEWMTSKSRVLGSRPIELLDSYIGISCVKDEIKRLIYGHF